MAEQPKKVESSPALTAVPPHSQDYNGGGGDVPLTPDMLTGVVRRLITKVEVSNASTEKIVAAFYEQGVVIRAMRHDVGVMASQVDRVLHEQSIIKELLTEVLDRLPTQDD